MMSNEVSTFEEGEEILKVNKPSWRKIIVESWAGLNTILKVLK